MHLLLSGPPPTRLEDTVAPSLRVAFRRTFGSRLRDLRSQLDRANNQLEVVSDEATWTTLESKLRICEKNQTKLEYETSVFVKDVLAQAPSDPPLVFSNIKARDFLKWIC